MNEETLQVGTTSLGINEILHILPHRYPMLMIDKIVDIRGQESAVGIKNVTANEPFFQGHFPTRPIMPGVLIIEAMAQTSAALIIHSFGEIARGRLVYFITIDNARFRKPVVPGDTLHIHVKLTRARSTIWKFHADAKVGEATVAEADYSAMVIDTGNERL
jgi:3-hydroxyacyl-[acyl-carrier-protein] dehydratase